MTKNTLLDWLKTRAATIAVLVATTATITTLATTNTTVSGTLTAYDATVSHALTTSTVNEYTVGAGVTLDSVQLKDAKAYVMQLVPSDSLASGAGLSFADTQHGIALTGSAGIKLNGVSDLGWFGAQWFGDGSSGNLTSSSGTTKLTAAAQYQDVTLTGTAILETANRYVFVNGTLDLSNAAAGAIRCSTAAAAAPSGSIGAVATTGTAAGDFIAAGSGSAGGNGGSAAGGGSGPIYGVTLKWGGIVASTATVQLGGTGGTGSGGSGGASSTTILGVSNAITPLLVPPRPEAQSNGVSSPWKGGSGGFGGGGGGGDAVATAPGGGAGGAGGCPVFVYARKLIVGDTTPAGVFRSVGGAASAGGDSPGGNRGGAGGGGGGEGGGVMVLAGTVTGSATNALQSIGGAAGNGGAGSGTGTAGGGGWGGCGGGVHLWRLDTQTHTSSGTTANSGCGTGNGAPTGATGGPVGTVSVSI